MVFTARRRQKKSARPNRTVAFDLTNWDALDLAGMVHRGTIVAFVR